MKSWFRHIRAVEALILLGIPVIGVLSHKNEIINIPDIFLIALSFFLIISHVYMFNDWANVSHDRFDKKRCDTLLFTGYAITLFLSFNTFITGVLIFIASFLYSNKHTFFKGVPILSSLIHVFAGTLYFLYGYLLYGHWTLEGVLIGIYFGMVYEAGHLNHEVKDYAPDIKAEIETSAVKYGPSSKTTVSKIVT